MTEEETNRIENLLKIFPQLSKETAIVLDKRLVEEVVKFFKATAEVEQDIVANDTFRAAFLVYVHSNITGLIKGNLIDKG